MNVEKAREFAHNRIADININGPDYKRKVISEIGGLIELSHTEREKLIKKASAVSPKSGFLRDGNEPD